MASHVTWAIEYSNSPVKRYRTAMAAQGNRVLTEEYL